MNADQIFDSIANFGNDPQNIIMYGGPIAGFFVFLAIVIYLKKSLSQT